MKIITWNCNGALRKKYESLLDFNADIHIIQECENPELSKDKKYIDWASNYLWIGDEKIYTEYEIMTKKYIKHEYNNIKFNKIDFLYCIDED